MVDKPKLDERAGDLKPNARLHEQAAGMLSIPQIDQGKRDKALEYVQTGPNEFRERLSPEDRATLNAAERMIVDADSSGLNKLVHKFADNPTGAENMMNIIVSDMTKVGIESTWNYAPKDKRDQEYDPKAPKDLGRLTLELVNPRNNAFTAIRFFTKGDTESLFNNGAWKTEPIPPESALATIREGWIKRALMSQ